MNHGMSWKPEAKRGSWVAILACTVGLLGRRILNTNSLKPFGAREIARRRTAPARSRWPTTAPDCASRDTGARWSAGKREAVAIPDQAGKLGLGLGPRAETHHAHTAMQVQNTMPVRLKCGECTGRSRPNSPEHCQHRAGRPNCSSDGKRDGQQSRRQRPGMRRALPEDAQQEHRGDAGREVAVGVEQVEEDGPVPVADQHARPRGCPAARSPRRRAGRSGRPGPPWPGG